jgi:hypothetical protein
LLDWRMSSRMSLVACVPGNVAVGAPVEWNSVPTDTTVGAVGSDWRIWDSVVFLDVPP